MLWNIPFLLLCKIAIDLDDSKVKTTINIGPNPWKSVVNWEGEQLRWKRCLGTLVGSLVGLLGAKMGEKSTPANPPEL